MEQANIAELIARNCRRAAAIAYRAGIDVDDGLQTFALAAMEAAGRYNPEDPRGATLEIYALSLYRCELAKLRAQVRYGKELDAMDGKEVEFVDLGDERLTTVDAKDTEGEEAVTQAWRDAGDVQIARRVSLLPPDLCAFAHRVISGQNVAEASERQGVSDRNGRYMVEKIIKQMRSVGLDAGQNSLVVPPTSREVLDAPARHKKTKRSPVERQAVAEQGNLFAA